MKQILLAILENLLYYRKFYTYLIVHKYMLVYVDIDILKNSIQELEQKKQNEKMNVRMSLYLRWKEGKVSFKELKWRHTQFAITSRQ